MDVHLFVWPKRSSFVRGIHVQAEGRKPLHRSTAYYPSHTKRQTSSYISGCAIRALQGCCEPHAPPSWTHCSANLTLNPSLSQCATRIVLILACQPSRRDPVPQSPNGLFSFLQPPFAEAFSPYDHIDIGEHATSSCFSQSHISFYRCNSTRARQSIFAGL